MKRLTAAVGLLLGAVACADSGASGELSYDYVYNTVDNEFHKNTLQGGELIASEVISAEEYDRESDSALTSVQMRTTAGGAPCGLQPGDYLLEYSVLADSCNIGPLESELFTFGAGAVVSGAMPVADGCTDEVLTEGCFASILRRCEVSNGSGWLSFDLTVAVDTATGTGTAMIRGLGSNPSAGSADAVCSSSQRVALERLN